MDRQEALDIALAQIEKNFGPSKTAPLKQHVATFTSEDDKVRLYFGTGSFDDWCIYVLGFKDKWMKFPTDEWYFGIVKDWTALRAPEAVYADFVRIYDATTSDAKYPATAPVVEMIKAMSWSYKDDFEACVIWTILYMGMIAEENKEGAILKKRIKRLGMHQILIDGMAPNIAAHFSRGKSSIELVMECHGRGF
jgi:hypothetical protein